MGMEVGGLGSKDVRKYGYLRLSGKAVENKIIRLFPSQKNQLDSKFLPSQRDLEPRDLGHQ